MPRPRTHDDRTGRVFPDHLITYFFFFFFLKKKKKNSSSSLSLSLFYYLLSSTSSRTHNIQGTGSATRLPRPSSLRTALALGASLSALISPKLTTRDGSQEEDRLG